MKQSVYITMACLFMACTAVSCKTNAPVDVSEKFAQSEDQTKHGQVTNIESDGSNGTKNSTDEAEESNQSKEQSLRGQVTKVTHGTDGYTAVIQATDGEIYHITASIPNCGQHGVFKSVQIGDSVHVQGEIWKMGNQRCMTVRTFLP